MIKSLTGSAISYGPVLPSAVSSADGVLFYLTANYTDANLVLNTPGLYSYTFQQDFNLGVVGDQVGTGWKQLSQSAATFVNTFNTRTGNVVLLSSDISGALGYTPGTVSSVGVTAGSGRLSVGGSPVTTSGNITLDVVESAINMGNLSGQININSQTTGTLGVGRGGTNLTSTTQGAVVYGASASSYAFSPVGTAGQVFLSGGTGAPSWANQSSVAAGSAIVLATARNFSLTGNATAPAVSFNGSADVVLNVTVNTSATLTNIPPATAATATTVAVRDGSGYLFAQYYNQASGNNEVASVSQFVITNGSDGFFRKVSINQAQNALGLSAFVLKSGDTMTGVLNVGTSGSVGSVSLVPTDATHTGYIHFSSQNGNRQGYIGYSTGTGATDTGTINFVMATGAFSGNINLGGTLTAQGDVVAYSDERIKKNIMTITSPLAKVQALRGVTYERKDSGKASLGVIAQEVREVLPELVHITEDGTMGVAYGNMVGLLIEAIKEQQRQIDELKASIKK